MKIITGMHRSGTSLVAKILFEAGADFGSPESFYPKDKWNTEGYFEQPDIHRINMPLIHGRLGKYAYFKLPSTATILRRAERLSTKIAEAIRTYRKKTVKETRFCLTLPAWIKYDAPVSHVII